MRPGHADISQATATTPVLACQVPSEMVVCVQVTGKICDQTHLAQVSEQLTVYSPLLHIVG